MNAVSKPDLGQGTDQPSRRQILRCAAAMGLSAGALSAGALSAAGLAPVPALAQPTATLPAAPGLTAEVVAAAEKLAAVTNTDAERAQMLATLEEQVERLRILRTLAPPNDLAPASTFDPRLPGIAYPAQENRVVVAGPVPPAPPRDAADIAFAPLTHLSSWIAAGKISSLDLTEIYLARIAAQGPRLECFVTVTAELARSQAAAADREIKAGRYRGPLHGVPYVLKDLADTAGIVTTWGAGPYRERRPTNDAAVTARLRDAGAVLLGKTTLGEIAYGDIWFAGTTRNPWNPAEGSSGSSAGTAAAVAAGLAGFGIGTETLGSIISPAHRCGVTGLRPTFGRVARSGCMALCWSLDKIGPMTRTVEDTALVLAAINGSDPGDPSSLDHGFSYDGPGLDGRSLRVGHVPAWFEGEGATDTDRAALAALKRTGATMVEITLPDLPVDPLLTTLVVEAAAAFEALTLSGGDDSLRWQGDNAWPNTWRAARFIPAIDLIQTDRLRRRWMQAMDRVFQDVDVIAGPNFAGGMLLVTNMTGHPQLALRAGFADLPTRPTALDTPGPADPAAPRTRVPRAFSLWAPLFEERRLVALGRLLEAELGVWAERPPG
ncbi:MAG: hypothetical protein RLY86_4271 [Pseudomonadota bacterium]|jgi:Asp-tRNA(Asn)/Glu-tRNA(Gln) amidotransferase A subunit family amidase